MNTDAAQKPILDIRDITTSYHIRRSGAQKATSLVAVENVTLSIKPGETLGLVGESGCGKSTLGRTIIRLLEPSAGTVSFAGQDITHFNHQQMRPLRQEMQIVFQDPYASLNPRFKVQQILYEPFRIHGIPRAAARQKIPELLSLVQLPPDSLRRFPHEFSGGQRQRIAIARALALEPSLLVLDEPVSALDVSIQAQILNLLEDLQTELGLAYLFIAHDLSVVGQVSDRVAVMYLGRIVEEGPRDAVFNSPQHPYTIALLSAIPDISAAQGHQTRERIILTGDLPNPLNPPSGCRFRTRCWRGDQLCVDQDPPLALVSTSLVACHYPGGEDHSGARS